jgi:hypothetical protein
MRHTTFFWIHSGGCCKIIEPIRWIVKNIPFDGCCTAGGRPRILTVSGLIYLVDGKCFALFVRFEQVFVDVVSSVNSSNAVIIVVLIFKLSTKGCGITIRKKDDDLFASFIRR